jgi:3-phenylpropionate/trans-cinnamate dioxygenase ferredoxin reductase subunit
MAPGLVIVGAGEAGARAALALREQGWQGPVTLIGDEGVPPYERPPLSKAVMTAADNPASAVIATHDRLAEAGIGFIHDTRAVRIDRASRQVHLADGRAVAFDKLLLATGAGPRRLTIEGAGHALYLRTFADALALRERLRHGARLLVIGGGFIGLEVAASAVMRGCTVTVLEMAPRVLMRGVPEEIAHLVAARHREAGVDLRTGVGLRAIAREDGGISVALDDGTVVRGDAVVAGVGAVPETALAESCGLAIENGIRVDEYLRTSDPNIFAAGDCCSFPAPLYGGARLRLEAWRNAQQQGALAARNMLGAGEPYAAVPWFWSDQYEQTLQVAGLPSFGASAVRREVPGAGLIYFHLAADGRLVAASGVGTVALAREMKAAERMVERRAYPDPAALASPAVKLRSLLAA